MIEIKKAHWCQALETFPHFTSGWDIANKAIEIAKAEAAALVNPAAIRANEAYITADEAQALGPENAEYRVNRISTGYAGVWRLCLEGCFYASSDANWEVQYRAINQTEPVAKKQVKLEQMPWGCAVYSERHAAAFIFLGLTQETTPEPMARLFSKTSNTIGLGISDLTLAPADQQPWLLWRGGECPVPEGVVVEVTLRNRFKALVAQPNKYPWLHDGGDGEIIAYRIAGLIDGWEMV